MGFVTISRETPLVIESMSVAALSETGLLQLESRGDVRPGEEVSVVVSLPDGVAQDVGLIAGAACEPEAA